MDTILVVGVDTLVGANLALECAAQGRVVGIDHSGSISLSDCEILGASSLGNHCPDDVIRDCDATHVVLCGPAAESSWDPATSKKLVARMVDQARDWALAANLHDSQFTYISSDAAFTGPWMLHDEECPGHCQSPQAALVCDAEAVVRQACSDALIVRTNAFGWSPLGENGWIERQLTSIARDRVVSLDSIRHGTPILATDLAKIIIRAWEDDLSGTFHIAGAERVNPAKFFQRLADRFELPWLSIRDSLVLEGRPQGFGEGECSLQTKKIRKALCLAMPIISESLDGLLQQYENGHCERLGHQTQLPVAVSGAAAA